jgi:hypothetical protein
VWAFFDKQGDCEVNVMEFPTSRVRNATMPLQVLADTLDRVVGGIGSFMADENRRGCAVMDDNGNAVLKVDKFVATDLVKVSLHRRDAEGYVEEFRCFAVFRDFRAVEVFNSEAKTAPLPVRQHLSKVLLVADAFLAAGQVRRTFD